MQMVVAGFAVKIFPLMHLSQRTKLHFPNCLIQIFFSPKELQIIFFFLSLNSWEFSPWMFYLGDFLEGITVPT